MDDFRFGRCIVDLSTRTLLRDGAAQAFEPKVFDALVYLLEHRDRVVPKSELLEHVWGRRVIVTEGVVARTIMKVRRLIGDDAQDPRLVKTVQRIGYRFAAEVTREPSSVARSDDATVPRGSYDDVPFRPRSQLPSLRPLPRLAPAQDTFVETVRARALQALAFERWESARTLLQVALDERPDDASLQLDFASCLVRLRDARAGKLLDRLLQRAVELGDAHAEQRCLHMLALGFHRRGDHVEAERLLARALSLAEREHDQDAELLLLQSAGDLAAEQGRTAIAEWNLDRASLLAQSLGNRAALARTLDSRGRIAAASGDAEGALRAFGDALSLEKASDLHGGAAHTLVHLGDSHQAFGRMRVARELYTEAFERGLLSGDPVAIAIAGFHAGRHGGIALGRDDLAATIERRMRAIHGVGQAAIDTFADLLSAALHARAGRVSESLDLIDRAEERTPRRHFRFIVKRYHVCVLVLGGFADEARDTLGNHFERSQSRLHPLIRVVGDQLLGTVAHAAGDRNAALAHMDAAIAQAPPSRHRLDASIDAAWLCLDGGDGPAAEERIHACADAFATALLHDHGPALLLRARQLDMNGDAEAAAALRRRRCADNGMQAEAPPDLPRTWHLLPSMLEFAPTQRTARLL